MQESPNIYRTARESVGFSREKASEKIGYSEGSLKVVENGERVPPDSVVIRMVEVYNAPYLALQHLRVSSDIGRELIPEMSEKQLAEAVCAFFASIPNLDDMRSRLIEIAADGRINDDEREDFDNIMDGLKNMVKCIYDLQYHRAKSE